VPSPRMDRVKRWPEERKHSFSPLQAWRADLGCGVVSAADRLRCGQWLPCRGAFGAAAAAGACWRFTECDLRFSDGCRESR